MSHRTEPGPFDNVLGAAVHALEEVVCPALDPGNPLASEQLRLVCRFLGLVRQRANFVTDLQRAELHCARDLAHRIAPHAQACPGDVREGLTAALQLAELLLIKTSPTVADLRHASQQLDAHVSCVVRCAAQFPTPARQAVERAILEGSRRVLDLRRAWLSPLGLDPEPSTVPALEAVLWLP